MTTTLVRNYLTQATWSTQPPFPQTLVGLMWDPYQNKEVGPRKSLTWNKVSQAHANAEWVITDNLGVSRTYLHVSDGSYAGYIIRKAHVAIVVPGVFPVSKLPSINPLDYPPRFQFQSGAPCGGSSCCTDTCIQMIVQYWTEKIYALSSIRYWAQVGSSSNTAPCTGINPSESIKALEHYGIYHYRVATNIDAMFVKSKIPYGPVLTGVYYGSYPNDAGGKCGPNNKALIGGGTDCNFNGAHAILTVGTSGQGEYALTRDPDHNSASRPEKPAYDKISFAQLDKTMKDLPTYTLWQTTFCIYSVKKKVL